MEDDLFDGIPVNLYASFFHDNKLYAGIVRTLSQSNMFLNTSMDFPRGSRIELHIPFMDEILRVPVRVKRFIKHDDIYNGVDVEVLEPDTKYLDFVGRLKTIPED